MLTDDLLRLSRVRGLARGGRARRLRLRAGLSIGEVAAALGVSKSTVFRWETSERQPRGKRALEYGRLLDALERRS